MSENEMLTVFSLIFKLKPKKSSFEYPLSLGTNRQLMLFPISEMIEGKPLHVNYKSFRAGSKRRARHIDGGCHL